MWEPAVQLLEASSHVLTIVYPDALVFRDVLELVINFLDPSRDVGAVYDQVAVARLRELSSWLQAVAEATSVIFVLVVLCQTPGFRAVPWAIVSA